MGSWKLENSKTKHGLYFSVQGKTFIEDEHHFKVLVLRVKQYKRLTIY